MPMRVLVALTAPAALVGCGDSSSSDPQLPTDPPSAVTKVTSGGFSSPTDAVASPDGRTFYFAGFDDQQTPAIFKVSSEPGSTAELLAVGEPFAAPTGLVLSCDGATLYIADLGADTGGDEGAIFSLSTAGGAVTDLGTTGVARPSGLAMHADCATLAVSGRTVDGKPGVFGIATAGGSARTVYAGDPLVSPTGLHIDTDGVHWLMDHRAAGMTGEGVLWAIPSDGSSITEVISDLRMGTTGGVSLTAGGGTAVMPTLDANGVAQLTSVAIASGEVTQLAVPDMTDPSGIRTARETGVFAVVDSEASAIYRAE